MATAVPQDTFEASFPLLPVRPVPGGGGGGVGLTVMFLAFLPE